jgi:hypothetical protein
VERPGRSDRAREAGHQGRTQRRSPEGGADLGQLEARIAALKARSTPSSQSSDGSVRPEALPEHEPPPRRWQWDVAGLVALFMGTRIILTVIGLVSRELVPGPAMHPAPLGIGPSYSSFSVLDRWGQWDTSWYLSIAEHGYRPVPLEGALANYAFFPLYPLLIRWVGWFFGSAFIGGLVVSNVAFIMACVFLYRLVALDRDAATARRAVKYLFAAPAAFLFSAVLSESLYLALAVMCFYFARTRQWWAVGQAGFFLALSRGPGVLVAIPLLYIYLEQRRFSLRRVRLDVLWLALLPAGLGVFLFFNWELTGDALSFARIQLTGWGHELQNPLAALWEAMTVGDVFISFNGWFMAVVLTLTVALLRKLGVAYALFALISIVLPLAYSEPGGSMVRYAVVIFPLYIVAARVSNGRPWLDQAITIISALLQGFLMSQWANNSLLVV